MRIAIDARMIRHGSMHGIARYVDELLNCLRAMPLQHQFIVLVNRRSPLLDKVWPGHMRIALVDSSWISFSEQWELPNILKRHQIDLFHSPSFVAPLLCPCRLVMTIHDLNHLVLPQFYTPLHQLYYHTFVRNCIKRSRFILTVSNFSKNEITRTLKIPSNKIAVTYNGVSEHYRPVTDPKLVEYVREIYELPERFVFCLSNNKPHKNVHQLVRAYCCSKVDLPLVLTCAADPLLIKIAESYGKKHKIYFSKFIYDQHLPVVYSMTELFVYPSTYEGFGLPPLEALACGAPVAVARSSSLPEVVGDNAIFLDPYDYHDIANALDQAISSKDRSPKSRKDAIEYAAKFTWQRMAVETLKTYERCFCEEADMVSVGV